MRYLVSALALSAAAAMATPAAAGTILSSNFDEISVPTGGYVLVPSASGWTAGIGQIEVQNNAAGAPYSPNNFVELDSTANSSMFYTLAAGTYNISYWYSPRPNVGSASNGIELWIGNTLLDSIAGAGGSTTSWGLRSVDFTTTGGDLTFLAVGTSDSYGGYLDDITISTAVPEPATWAMMILGFGMVGGLLRRRRTAVRVTYA